MTARGAKHTPEAIERMRAAALGRKHTPESIERMRVAKLSGIPLDKHEDYRVLRRNGFKRAEAMKTLGLTP